MASLQIISSNCKWPDCEARATRRVIHHNGEADGDYCRKHGDSRLIELAKEEGLYGPRETEPKPVKAVKNA